MTHHGDFLGEIVDERAAINPAFVEMADAAYEQRLASRARGRMPEGDGPPEDPGRSDRGEAESADGPAGLYVNC